MTYNDTTDTLICTSTGGLVSVSAGSCSSRAPVSFSQHIVGRVTMRYGNVTIWRPEDQGKYVCSVRSELKSSHAVLLTEYDVSKFVVSFCNYQSTHCTMPCLLTYYSGQVCSNQVVGRQGEQFTLLCLADEPVENATWTADTSKNITFTQLHESNARTYTCKGTIGDQVVMSSVTLSVSGMSAILYYSECISA